MNNNKYRNYNYTHAKRNRHCRIAVIWLLLAISLIIYGTISRNDNFTYVSPARASDRLISPLDGIDNIKEEKNVKQRTEERREDKQGAKNELRKQIISYLKIVFKSEWENAYAVSMSECKWDRVDFPECVNSTHAEHSIGLFQINLADDYGHGIWIHASKVPGKTIAEKEEWLKNPFNNILIAKMIYDASGWNPWSGWTSERYKEFLQK